MIDSDPGFPSPELSLPPMVPQPATADDEIDEYYLDTPKRVPKERTPTVAPEETDDLPAQDPYDVPNSPETVAPLVSHFYASHYTSMDELTNK